MGLEIVVRSLDSMVRLGYATGTLKVVRSHVAKRERAKNLRKALGSYNVVGREAGCLLGARREGRRRRRGGAGHGPYVSVPGGPQGSGLGAGGTRLIGRGLPYAFAQLMKVVREGGKGKEARKGTRRIT